MTISAESIPYVAASIIEMEEKEFFFTANVGFEDIWGNDEEKVKRLREYEAQLDKLVDFYAGRPDLYPVAPLLCALPDYLGYEDKGETIRRAENVKRFCGAGHEMVVIDADGKKYPCHRFVPWITGRPAPTDDANCQMAWKPEKCADCKLVLSCPICAGFNWEVYGDTGMRTTFHCDAFKLEVMASAKLEAIRLSQKLDNLDNLSTQEKLQTNKRLKAVWELIENDI